MTEKQVNPFSFSTDPELHMMFDKMMQLKDKVDSKFKQATQIAGLGETANFIPLDQVSIKLPSFDSLRHPSSIYRSTPVSLERVKDQAERAIQEAQSQIAAVEQANVPKIAHNTGLVLQIKTLMLKLGFAETYKTYEYPTSRSKSKKEVIHSAGYVQDIQRLVPRSNTQEAKHTLADYSRRLDAYLKKEVTEEQAKINKADADAYAKLMANPTLVSFLMSHQLNVLQKFGEAPSGSKQNVLRDTVNELETQLLAQNKYLRLAHYLMLNRNDWNDGCSYAECGLDSFEVESDEDKEIAGDIRYHIENWDGDGRVFRDCEWNYSRLFAKVTDSKLMEDWQFLTDYRYSIGA